MTPPALDRVVKTMSCEGPGRSLADGERPGSELKWIAEGGSQGGISGHVVTSRKGPLTNVRIAWSVAAFVLLGFVAVLIPAFRYFLETPREAPVQRTTILPPENTVFDFAATLGLPAVSPDGRRLAFSVGLAGGTSQLYIRPLDALTAQPLAGTEGATFPFWSPDSRFIGFFADGKLKKIDASGGPSLTLADAPVGRGGTWSADGVIVFAPLNTGPLQRVSASGGTARPATTIDTTRGETAHRLPWFLPDAQHFLYAVGGNTPDVTIRIGSLLEKEHDALEEQTNSGAIYTQGYLLFLRENELMAQPFDPKRRVTTAEAVPIAEQVQHALGSGNAGIFSASDGGLLAFQASTGPSAGFRLTWFDRSGKQLDVPGDQAAYSSLALSPDGRRASINISDPASKTRNIWLYDVIRGLRTRFTFGQEEVASAWSPDGSWVVFNSRRKEHLDLYQKASSGASTEELLLADNLEKFPESWSRDGRFILYSCSGGPTNYDLFVLPLAGERKPVPFLQTPFNERQGRFSPDGRWVAYVSDESGRDEVYVTPFPNAGSKWQVSTAGGNLPRWGHDGNEIFYVVLGGKVMAATVNVKGGNFEVGAVRQLFQTRIAGAAGVGNYELSPDGQRFLIVTAPEQALSPPITLVQNWTAELKK